MSNFDQIENCPKLPKPIKIHINVDTGMNRLGFRSHDDIKKALRFFDKNEDFIVEGIYTHFSTADENFTYFDFQLGRFMAIYKMLGYAFKMIHVSNSSAQMKFEKQIPFTTHTRLGISLYGLTNDFNKDILKNTFCLKTRISQLNILHAGDRLGYGADYIATSPEIVAVLPIGYADGFIRKNSGGDVEINGKRYPIIGRVCMDQMFVRVDNTVSKNDEVILFGGLVSIDEVAKRLDTINYEIICDVTKRVPREYIK
jgi:alanine racemase